MATRARVTVPELQTPPPGADLPDDFPDDGFGRPVAFDHPGLNRFRETGDMAALQEADFNEWSWTVYRIRTAEEMARAGARYARVFVTKSVGPFDVVALQSHFGGGVYEIRGMFNGQLGIRHLLEIEGQRRNYDAPAPARPAFSSYTPPPAPASHVSDTSEPVLRLLEQQGRILDKIAERLATPAPAVAAAPAPVAPTTQLADLISLANLLNQREVATPTSETVKEIIGVFRQGMDLKAEISGGGAGPDTTPAERIFEKVIPSLERIAVGIFTAGPRAARPGGPRPGPAPSATSNLPEPPPVVNHAPSSAVVMEPAPPAPAPDESGDYRWKSALEALANSIGRDDDPRDFPDTLELILPDDDLAMLRMAPDDAVIERVRAAAGGALEVLNTDAAAVFIRAMLAELREPSEVGED